MRYGYLQRLLVLLTLLMSMVRPAQGQVWLTPPITAPGLEYRSFQSQAVGGAVSYHVLLPPSYSLEPTRRFPVLFWLHGSNSVTTGIAPMSEIFLQAMNEKRLPELLVVFPNGLPYGMWCDAVSGLQPVESMFIELVGEVDLRFRTRAERAGRVLEGFSMGGYGAARIGLLHHQLFSGFSMLGAGPLQLDFLADNPNYQPLPLRQQILAQVYGNSLAIFEARSPWRLAEEWGPSLPANYPIRQIIGSLDASLQPNRDFRTRMQSLSIPHVYVEVPGVGHAVPPIVASMGDAFWSFHRRALGDQRLRSGFEASVSGSDGR